MTTDEQKIKLIEKELRDWDGHRFKDEVAKAILNSLKQFDPEPLDAEIFKVNSEDPTEVSFGIAVPNFVKYHDSKQKAIDYCDKHGYRVIK